MEDNNQGEPPTLEPGTEVPTGDVSEDDIEAMPDDELLYYSEIDSDKAMHSQPKYDSKDKLGAEPIGGDSISEGDEPECIPPLLAEHRRAHENKGSVMSGEAERQRNKKV
ncbi:hypothetical protein GN244_ATG10935 [Phytophthora infestans]|uniref:Uncharacterized protein n=1 Tax=Phytophthora infestans TaxID=4787 RepID=A0A833W0N9_PHYIN|nr:hypothetical protein GN244_ATG10935 [Phytophthora infestans]KAF4136184.1 hypothetical protein GN958_ATG14624 [Phytophthora infestans]